MFTKKIETLILIFLLHTILLAQGGLRKNLFGDYEKLLDQLQQENAEVLAPENFKRAVENFKEASRDYENKEESLVDIKEKLQKSRDFALEALKIVHLAKDTLQSAIAARDKALRENAPIFAPDEWDKAEDVFADATANLEDDDIDDAVEYGAEAADLYTKTTIKAIRNGILGDARNQLSLARQEDAEQYCLNTLRSAENLLAEAEAVLKNDPYDKETATQKAMAASYEARHAQFLAKVINGLSDKQELMEPFILKMEALFTDLATPFHYVPKFDKGFDEPAKTILGYILNLKSEEARLLAENSKMEEELSSLKESEATKSAALLKKELQEQKIQKVKDLFTAREAEVVYQGDKLLIRLVGLQFPSGRAIIQPEYFSLLTKVQRVIREFPDKYLVVEGHTDATGNSFKNKILSEQRARAVTEYLIANLELNPDQIQYYGMGEQKPIASNKTREGRQRNRRIDIIINLGDS